MLNWYRIHIMIQSIKRFRVLLRLVFGFSLLTAALWLIRTCEPIPDKFETEDNFIPMTTFLYDNQESYSDFIQVMEASNLSDALSSYNPNGEKYTLFLPTNDAFDRFFEESEDYSNLDDLLADTEIVHAMSRYHVVNRMVFSNDFPLGALPDTSLTGDFLTIAYIEGEDSTYYKVNNFALVEVEDLQMTNGIIHVIDQVLEPITFSGYDWLRANDDYSIIADLFDLTGLKDTLAALLENEQGELDKNPYSLLVEADSIFNKTEVYAVDDLIELYSDGNTDYTDTDNGLWQFAAYHILEEAIFLADLKLDEQGNPKPFNYNTYASLPVQITAGLDIIINRGVEVFDSVQVGDSWELIDYLKIKVNESNVQTKNGPIHVVDRVMELFRPNRTQRTFQFYEEPVIQAIRNDEREYIFKSKDLQDFTVLSWAGVEEFIWFKSSSSFEQASNRDYIFVDGDFSISYNIPQILPGRYGFQIRANSAWSDNATVQVFLDGKKVGGNVNLTTGGASGNNPYRLINLGVIDLTKYEKHNITIRSLIPGRFIWDFVRFESDLKAYNENNQ